MEDFPINDFDQTFTEEETAALIKAFGKAEGKLTDEQINTYLEWAAEHTNVARSLDAVIKGIFKVQLEGEDTYVFEFTSKGKKDFERWKEEVDKTQAKS